MLTPSFEAKQNDEFVILTIRVPYIKISEAEIDIFEKDFKFHCSPYFLWLQFSGQVIENGSEKAQYDVDTGNIIVHIPKKTKSEHFTNLGMLTSLLGNKKTIDLRTVAQKPSIQVLSTTTESEEEEKEEREEEGAGPIVEEFDDIFTIEKDILQWTPNELLINTQKEEALPSIDKLISGLTKYGFANQHSGVFTKLHGEIPSIVDCPDPDHLTVQERRIARLAHEQTNFNPEYYLADLMDDDRILEILQFVRPNENVDFSKEEKQVLKELPNKEYLLDPNMERCLLLGLVDIVFACAYNDRTTEMDNTVESAWTVCKISATLSWLEEFKDLYEVLYSCYRRSLCYPLYRHWRLTETIFKDTMLIFKQGKRSILKCLISLHQLLNGSEPYYIMNNLYINDYCIWLQHIDENTIMSLSQEISKISVEKFSLGLDLCELEEAAYLVLEEEEEETEEEIEEEVEQEEETEEEIEEEIEQEEEEETEKEVEEETKDKVKIVESSTSNSEEDETSSEDSSSMDSLMNQLSLTDGLMNQLSLTDGLKLPFSEPPAHPLICEL